MTDAPPRTDLAPHVDPELLDALLHPRPGIRDLSPDPTPVAHEDLPGHDGGPGLRIHRPARPEGAGRAPGVLFVHGGGFVAGTPEQFDLLTDHYARELGAVVVAPRYRLAPAHPFPAAIDDVHAALRRLADGTDVPGVDPQRLAIVGISAGATIAAGVALRVRDEGRPVLRHVSLQSPLLDDRHDTVSSHQVADPRTWNREASLHSWAAYLGGASGDGISPLAAPARATHLTGLPSTFLSVGQWEVGRDETLAFAQRLAAAGVPTELHLYPGAWHGFEVKAPHAAVSRGSLTAQIGALRRALTSAAPPPPPAVDTAAGYGAVGAPEPV